MNTRGALYVEDSGNTKIIGSLKADATYASIQGSCPNSCALKEHGCYAQDGWTAMTVRRLDADAAASQSDVTVAEALAIDNSYAGGPVPKDRALRLHVSGDARTVKAARALGAAVKRWQKRGGGKAWTYTHAWRTVGRSSWSQSVSVLASVESPKQAAEVRRRGYAPALVVESHASDKAFVSHGVRWIPCPAQTRHVGCTDCRLCFDADGLFARRAGIAFAAHGSAVGKREVKKRLVVLNNSR